MILHPDHHIHLVRPGWTTPHIWLQYRSLSGMAGSSCDPSCADSTDGEVQPQSSRGMAVLVCVGWSCRSAECSHRMAGLYSA